MSWFEINDDFELEGGGKLGRLELFYSSYGTLNESRDNVIWICHALTASADVQSWWPGMIGKGGAFDPETHFIICVNILGSCYGTTGPLSVDPQTATPYYQAFPFITIRDMVKAYQLLARHLGIRKIDMIVGGSMGGYQALEWCVEEPSFINHLFLIATAAKETAWRIAIHETQRLAIEADSTWGAPRPDAGEKGLAAARAVGILTYRNAAIFNEKQTDEDGNKKDDFKVSSYIRYQANKLTRRFNAYSYWFLTKAMDSHNLSRGRNKKLEEVLGEIQQPTLVMGVKSDILCPPEEQEFLAAHIPGAKLVLFDSRYGHDGFLTEVPLITQHIQRWLSREKE